MHHEDIKAAIRKKGVTPADLARHLEVSEQLVGAVIKGRSKSARVAKAIAKVTGLKLDVLWPGTYDKKSVGRRVAELLG